MILPAQAERLRLRPITHWKRATDTLKSQWGEICYLHWMILEAVRLQGHMHCEVVYRDCSHCGLEVSLWGNPQIRSLSQDQADKLMRHQVLIDELSQPQETQCRERSCTEGHPRVTR